LDIYQEKCSLCTNLRILTIKSTNRNADKSQQELGMRKVNSFEQQQSRNDFGEMAMVRLKSLGRPRCMGYQEIFKCASVQKKCKVRLSLDGKVQAISLLVYHPPNGPMPSQPMPSQPARKVRAKSIELRRPKGCFQHLQAGGKRAMGLPRFMAITMRKRGKIQPALDLVAP
jgi:hypothetical protein